MLKSIPFKVISKERTKEIWSSASCHEEAAKALKSGELNNAIFEDFMLNTNEVKDFRVNNFIWKEGHLCGKVSNCIFSNGEMHKVKIDDIEMENVTFKNIKFDAFGMGEFYEQPYIFKFKNILFEDCIFEHSYINQAVNSDIYLVNCKLIRSYFYIKNSTISFDKCDTANGGKKSFIDVKILEPLVPEPLKIKECLFFRLELFGDAIDCLNISAKKLRLKINESINNINNLKIYSDYFFLDTRYKDRFGKSKWDTIEKQWAAGLPPTRSMEKLEICAQYGTLGIYDFKIKKVKLMMSGDRYGTNGAVCCSHIEDLEMITVKLKDIFFHGAIVDKIYLKYCYFGILEFEDFNSLDCTIESLKISEKFVLKKSKIGHLSLERASIAKQAAWETESSTIGVLEKKNAQGVKQEVDKNLSGQKLLSYFEHADVEK
jgi:hypothetical protein